MSRVAKLMTPKPQQQTLSVRISEPLRLRLERAKQLIAARSGKPVSTSEVAKQLLESAREDRLEVVELLAHPTETLLQIRRKGEAGYPLSRAEWAVLAHFVQQGVEALSSKTPNPVSRDSLMAGAGCVPRRVRSAHGSRVPVECRVSGEFAIRVSSREHEARGAVRSAESRCGASDRARDATPPERMDDQRDDRHAPAGRPQSVGAARRRRVRRSRCAEWCPTPLLVGAVATGRSRPLRVNAPTSPTLATRITSVRGS